MSNEVLIRLNNKFKVSEFMENIELDYLYSYNLTDKSYYLLNNETFGEISSDLIERQKKTKRIVVIEVPINVLKAYNIPEDELTQAFIDMGRL